MSSFGLVDFIANNLLDQVGANPVWERIRKHFYAVGFGISLFLLYFNIRIRVECVPTYTNGTVMKTDLRSRHVNEYCENSGQLIVFSYSGCMLVGMNAIVLLAASYWLYIPSVIEAIRSFSKICGLVKNIHVPLEELKRLMATPMTAGEVTKTPKDPTDLLLKQKKIRKLRNLLPSFKEKKDHKQQESKDAFFSYRYFKHPCSTFSASYLFRNCLLGIIYILNITGSTYLIICLFQKSYTFTCTYDLTNDCENYICAVGGTRVAIVCTLFYAMVQFVQLISIFYGYKVSMAIVGDEKKTGFSSIVLIARFCKSSESPDSGILGKLIEFFFSEDFMKTVDYYATETKNRDDNELQKLSLTLYDNSLHCLTSSDRKYDSETFRDKIHKTTYKLGECIELAELLVKHELWETLVFLLDNVEALDKSTPEDEKNFANLLISFDSLATWEKGVKNLWNDLYDTALHPTPLSSHIILYYAINLGSRKNFDVARFLLSRCKPTNPCVHHYVAIRQPEPALQYVESRWDIYENRDGYKDLIHEMSKCNKKQSNYLEYKCQKVLQNTLDVYKEKAENVNIRFRICRMLERRRFRRWDETASAFLEFAKEKKHYEIEFALLSAYFPDSPLRHLGSQKSIPSDECMKKIFTHLNYELDDCKYLTKHLAEIFSWELLVGLLGNTRTRCDKKNMTELHDFSEGVTINLTERQSHPGSGGNIVSQALEPRYERRHPGNHRFTVASFLLMISEPAILDVIKTDGSKIKLSEYLETISGKFSDIAKEDFDEFKQALAGFESQAAGT